MKRERVGESKSGDSLRAQCHTKLAKNAFAAFHFYLATHSSGQFNRTGILQT